MYLLSTGKQRAAKLSQVLVGQQSLAFASWGATLRIGEQPTVNFLSYVASATPQPQTFDESIGTIFGCDLKFGGDWDAGTNPYGSPPGLFPRDDLASLYFMVNRTDNTPYTFPYAALRTCENSGEITGKVLFSCSGKSQGSFTVPTNSA